MRKFDNPAMNDGDNSDAYSFEARSEISDNNDTQGPPGASGEAVRPDSLALTSPLEQLTRSLSFNKKDGQHAPPLQQSARGGVRERIAQDSIAGLPSAEQVMLEYLAAETNYDSNASTSGQPRQDASIGQQQQHLPNAVNSNSQHAASHETAFDTTFEPVRFSNDTTRTGGTEDVSDSQGQLINAFRSSYHTYMTRSGGMRDSSYSWMGPDADSPNMTMDFKQAEASFDAARRNGEAIDLGRYDDFEGEDDSGDLSAGQPGEDLDADGKAKARSSSWDSQEVKKMGLNRIPSQKSQKTHKTPTDGRTSDVSAFEPFQYSVGLA